MNCYYKEKVVDMTVPITKLAEMAMAKIAMAGAQVSERLMPWLVKTLLSFSKSWNVLLSKPISTLLALAGIRQLVKSEWMGCEKEGNSFTKSLEEALMGLAE